MRPFGVSLTLEAGSYTSAVLTLLRAISASKTNGSKAGDSGEVFVEGTIGSVSRKGGSSIKGGSVGSSEVVADVVVVGIVAAGVVEGMAEVVDVECVK